MSSSSRIEQERQEFLDWKSSISCSGDRYSLEYNYGWPKRFTIYGR